MTNTRRHVQIASLLITALIIPDLFHPSDSKIYTKRKVSKKIEVEREKNRKGGKGEKKKKERRRGREKEKR